MRSVNLIPPDERRGDAAPLRTGYLIYVLVGGLAILLLGIVVVALTSKQINDREAKKADLQTELAQETARAQSVAAFTNFRSMQENRATTVSSLAKSRFDWQRVLRELALVLPSDITLANLTGTVDPTVQVEDAEQISLRTGASGPALEIVGCAPGQDSVASLVAALQDIDGVTRVGIESSKVLDPELDSGTASGSGGSGGSSGSESSGDVDCQNSHLPDAFKIVVAFDAVPAPPTATSSPAVPPAAVPPTSGTQAVASTQTPGS
jgi:Tfp pilus assembly protein PilN